MPTQLVYTSPTPGNIEINSLPAPPAGGVPAFIVQSKSPDIITAVVPANSLYDIGSNPLVVSPLPSGSLFFVDNKKATSIKVVGSQIGDAGIIVPSGAFYLLAGREAPSNGGSSTQFIGGGVSTANSSYVIANVKNYSQTPIGSGQNATAALAAAIASGIPIIYFPTGAYVIDPTLITNTNIWIVGDGQGLSIIQASAGSNKIFTFQGPSGQGTLGGGIRNLTVSFPGLVSPSCAIYLFNLTNFWIDNIKADNCLCIVTVGDGITSANNAYGIYLSKILADTCVNDANTAAFLLLGGGGCYMRDCSINTLVPLPAVNQDMATAAGACGFKVSGLGWTTLTITDTIFYKFDRGIFLDCQTGTAIVDVWLSSALCDYCGTAGLDINAAVNSNIANVHVVNGWYVGWNDVAINIRGLGYKQVCVFTNTRAWFAGKEAIHIGTTNTIYGLTMTGMEAFFSNRQGGGQSTVVIENGVQNFTITGGVFNIDLGAVSPPGYSWTSPHAFTVGADCDNYSITGVVAYPIAAGFVVAANSAGSKNRMINNNTGASYAGNFAFAAPATTVAKVNTTPFKIEVYIAGVLTALAKNGVTLGSYGVGDGKFVTLAPGESVTPTYGGAMVFNAFAQP